MARTLTDSRALLDLALRNDGNSFSDTEKDYFIRTAFEEFLAYTGARRTTGTKTLTANIPEADLSTITGFEHERFLWAEIEYPDKGTWLVTGPAGGDGTYAVNDIVQGDGDPDSYLYRCTTAHTAAAGNEPPNSTYWTQIYWKRGTPVTEVSYHDIASFLGGHEPGFFPPERVYARAPMPLVEGGHYMNVVDPSPGRPTHIGFLTETTAYLASPPDTAYTLTVVFTEPLVTWTAGTGTPGSVTMNLPDGWHDRAVATGAAAYALYPDPDRRAQSPQWQQWMNLKNEARADLMMTSRVAHKNPAHYK